ncbi:MAG TPA: Bro-N domain-containing protein [Clostridiales bacterium]|nr:Bro-N domain-containing protein [Clostridiales bacterium]HQP69705.1 Bro-N domain-containing protein [Clostridiales bacterium]
MSNIKLFESKKIRSHWDEKEEKWYFSVVDVVEVLTGSINPTDYLKKLRKRDTELGNYIGTNCPQVEMITTTGKYRKTLAATAENLLRIIQSVPSPKAEPFKLWLAKVGYERLEEIENPELAQERMKELYELKGYPKDWIDKRLRGIAVRQNLTEEWKKRGIESQSDFAILSAEISKATFGMTPGQYKEFKNLPEKSRANLRDHMNDLELIFTMLGERVTTEISQKEKPETFNGNKDVAKRGGTVAGNARKETEKELNRSIISKENYLELDNKLKIDTEEE